MNFIDLLLKYPSKSLSTVILKEIYWKDNFQRLPFSHGDQIWNFPASTITQEWPAIHPFFFPPQFILPTGQEPGRRPAENLRELRSWGCWTTALPLGWPFAGRGEPVSGPESSWFIFPREGLGAHLGLQALSAGKFGQEKGDATGWHPAGSPLSGLHNYRAFSYPRFANIYLLK